MPCTVPSSPYGPCSRGITTSTSSPRRPELATRSPNEASSSPSTGNAPGSAAGPAAMSAVASPPASHRPSVVIPTGTISYRSGSSALATATAVTRETSCSAERPPNSSITRRRVTPPSSRRDLEHRADAEAHDEQAAEAVEQLDAPLHLRAVLVQQTDRQEDQ